MSSDDFLLPVRPGQTLKDGRYTIRRKIGGGLFSSVYLVQDDRKEFGKYLAAKILTRNGTERHRMGQMKELQFLKAVQPCEGADSLAVLRDDFEVNGPRGSHLCLVMDLCSTSLSSFRQSFPNMALPPSWVKNIISLVLGALDQLHKLNILHTDIKPDNILFTVSDQMVEEALSTEGVQTEEYCEIDGERWPILQDQPIKHKFSSETSRCEAELVCISLVGLGQGQWAGKQLTNDDFRECRLRPPEVILKSSSGPAVDIWEIGCLTFELLVGHPLFHPPDGRDDWRPEEHIADMMRITGESFPATVLDHAELRGEYFETNGDLLRVKRDNIQPTSIEDELRKHNVMQEYEIEPAAEFIRPCIHLDPVARPDAEKLQLHPWFEYAFRCDGP